MDLILKSSGGKELVEMCRGKGSKVEDVEPLNLHCISDHDRIDSESDNDTLDVDPDYSTDETDDTDDSDDDLDEWDVCH